MKTITFFSSIFLFLNVVSFAGTVTVQPMAPATICQSNCVTLSAQASGGTAPYTYSWFANGSAVTTQACPAVTTTYTVIASDNAGSVSAPATVQISVNPPLEVMRVDGVYNICPGSSVSLNAVASGGNGGSYTYSWTPSAGLSNPNIANPVATPTVTTYYTVIVSDNCGTPPDSSSGPVTIYPTTQVAVSSVDTTICAWSCPHITGISNPACASAVWNFGDGTTGTGCSSATHCYSIAGIYQVTYKLTDVNGCLGSASLDFHVLTCTAVNNLPSLDKTLRFYPNPVVNKLSIQCDWPDAHRSIRIFDGLGREVWMSSMPEASVELDLSFLPKGIYFLQLRSGDDSVIRKISRE